MRIYLIFFLISSIFSVHCSDFFETNIQSPEIINKNNKKRQLRENLYDWNDEKIEEIIEMANDGDLIAQELIIKQACMLNLKSIGAERYELIDLESWQNLEDKIKESQEWLEGYSHIYSLQGDSFSENIIQWLQSITIPYLDQEKFENPVASVLYAEYLSVKDYETNKETICKILDQAINGNKEASAYYLKSLLVEKYEYPTKNNLKLAMVDLEISSKRGYIPAKEWLCSKLIQNKKYNKAICELNNIIKLGGTWAYYYMGRIYEDIHKNDQKARSLYKKGARTGDLEAKTNYGNFLLNGIGGKVKKRKGLSLLKNCCENGHIRAKKIIKEYRKSRKRLYSERDENIEKIKFIYHLDSSDKDKIPPKKRKIEVEIVFE